MKIWKQFREGYIPFIIILVILIVSLNLYIQRIWPTRRQREGFDSPTTNPPAILNDYPYGNDSNRDNLSMLSSGGNLVNSVYETDPSDPLGTFIQSNTEFTKGPPDQAVSSSAGGNPINVMPIYPDHDSKFDNPYSPHIRPRIGKYIPTEDVNLQYSKLTGLSNATPVYYANDVGEGFCKFHKTNSMKLEEECNRLDNDVCASTSCCVLLGGSKCVYGDKMGAKMTSNYTDLSIQNRDKYYYMGKCYGNCKERKYKYESPLVPSSHCSPPRTERTNHTYATPYLQNQVIQQLELNPLVDDEQKIYSNIDGPVPDNTNTIIPNAPNPGDIVQPDLANGNVPTPIAPLG
jgi:hypothetical protein